jgi:hypothetical protein
MSRRHPGNAGIALPAALVALAVSAALGAALAELAGTELLLVRNRRAGATALAASDACLSRIVAGLGAGWHFDAELAGPDALAGTPDDGSVTAPSGCTARLSPAPGPSDPPRAHLDVEAEAGGGRHILDAVVGRTRMPGVPALLWFAEMPAAGAVTGTFRLDGIDARDGAAPSWASIAGPVDPPTLDAWIAGESGHLVATAGTNLPFAAPAPPLAALALRLRAAGPSGPEGLVPAGTLPAPGLMFIAHDHTVTTALAGAGLLFVDGVLDIGGSLDFTGVVVASGGVRIGSTGALAIAGALWLGAPVTPGTAVVVDGTLTIGQDHAAVDEVDARLTLPRRAGVLGLRDGS